ncbi:hypothetical protein H2200_006879 [Cladophialophora chaetospira]|uniref:Uncharacterized protein n=1 Tax=Cladophialophora chaetospira TaxID=386627 RepID=A0AA38X917_9EURO|nr:hypothetical protein H2200_006879 [Cladophialophora chaetospira]
MAASTVKETICEPHPAEMSEVSKDPQKRLMGIPRELRDKIYTYLLVRDRPVVILFAEPTYPSRWCRQSFHDEICRYSFLGPRNTIGIMLVSKQACNETRDVLYGKNTFDTNKFRGFNNVFINGNGIPKFHGFTGIGTENATKIRTAAFRLKVNTYRDTQDHNDRADFLNILCTQLSGLRHLTLKIVTQNGVCQDDSVRLNVKSRQTRSIRALLTTATRVTKFHPLIRKAVWRKWSGSYASTRKVYCPFSSWPMDEDAITGEFHVDLVPVGHVPVVEGSRRVKNYRGVDFDSVDLVLDSLAIRETPWEDIPSWCNFAKCFKLDAAATTSEKNSAEVQTWPGMDSYDPTSEVHPAKRAHCVARRKMWGDQWWVNGLTFEEGDPLKFQWGLP